MADPGTGNVVVRAGAVVAALCALGAGMLFAGWAGVALGAAGLLAGGVGVALWTVSRRRRWAGLRDDAAALGSILRPEAVPAGAEAGEIVRGLLAWARARGPGGAEELSNLRAVFNAVDSPVIATSSEGKVVLANRAAAAFFDGRPPGGRLIEDLFTQGEVLGVHRTALSGVPGRGQVRMARPEGARTYEVLAFPLALRLPLEGSVAPAVPETGAVLTLRDVTELALAMQLKTDFVANASHELRTPLSSIKAATETLSDSARDDPAMRDRLAAIIRTNVTRLEELVSDLLDLSRLESAETPVHIQAVDAPALAREAGEAFRAVCAERRLTIAYELDPRLARMDTDPKLLRLILGNLIDNATKYAYEGTTIRVVGEVDDGPEGSRPGGARFRVIDRGVGIPIGQQQRIFERFFQVDQSRSGAAQRRGTGLGLAIVKHAVRALGGTIGVESVWKSGTTLTVELPGSVASGEAAGANDGR